VVAVFIRPLSEGKGGKKTSPNGVVQRHSSLLITALMMLATAISSRAQFTSLASFTGTNGDQP
jgi:hypothetical protein